MKRLVAALLLPLVLLIDWFVIEYYKPVKKYEMRKP